MRYLTSLIFALALSVAFVACGGGGGEAECAEPIADPGGVWCMTDTNIENTCGDPLPPRDYFLRIGQQGSDLSAASNFGWLEGTICGDQIRMSGEFSRTSGDYYIASTGNMELSISADGNSVEGSEAWTWTDPNQTCRGKNLVSGYRC
jgi:hypothetical protein